MNISTRNKDDTITFCQGMHIYTVDLKTLAFGKRLTDSKEKPTEVVFEGEIFCIRPDCPACAAAAQEHGLPGYKVPVHSIAWPILGDIEALEIHLRHRMQKGGKNLETAITEIEPYLPDTYARARLQEAVKEVRKAPPTL